MIPSRNVSCSTGQKPSADTITSAQRMSAITLGLVGVCGAAVAFVSIRWIGNRAHSLVSVNYLSVLSTMVSAICLLFVPGTKFQLPADSLEWAYLLSLGVCGFIMQFLITKGLQNDKSGSRATNMVYTQLIFALAFDYIFLGKTPALFSIVGGILILGSVLFMALHVDDSKVKKGEGTVGDGELTVVFESTSDQEEEPAASALSSGTYMRLVQDHEGTNDV